MLDFSLPLPNKEFTSSAKSGSDNNSVFIDESKAEGLLRKLTGIALKTSLEKGIPQKKDSVREINDWLDSLHSPSDVSAMSEIFNTVSTAASKLFKAAEAITESKAVQQITSDISNDNFRELTEQEEAFTMYSSMYSEKSALNFLKNEAIESLLNGKLQIKLGDGKFLVLDTGFFINGIDSEYDADGEVTKPGEGSFMNSDADNRIFTLRFKLLDLSGQGVSEERLETDLGSLIKYQLANENELSDDIKHGTATDWSIAFQLEGLSAPRSKFPELSFRQQIQNPSANLDISIDCDTGKPVSTNFEEKFSSKSGASFNLGIENNLKDGVSWVSAAH